MGSIYGVTADRIEAPGAVAGAVARARALALLKRFGWNATSFQSLEPGIRYWFDEAGDACIAYTDTGQAWVVAGAPIAEEVRFPELVERFLAEARQAGRRVCFFAVEGRLVGRVPLEALPIGEQPVWDPAEWPAVLASARALREQLRRSRAKGVTVRLAGPEDVAAPEAPVRRAIEGIVARWLAGRRMAPLGFLVQIELLAFPAERRILVAELGGHVVGFLAMVPVYARRGWLLEDLLRDPSAPNGTTELLIDAAMRLAEAEGSRYVTLGLAPLSGEVSGWLRLARRFGAAFYRFEGVRVFKAKLRPRHWEPIFLAYPPGHSGLLAVHDALAAFAPGGLLRFAAASLVRAPTLPLRVLTALLAPWTLLLASAATARWFPASWIQNGWVVFDVLLLAGLVPLSLRWRSWLAALLASLITADALLTLTEVLAFNVPRARTPLDWGVALVAVLGPSLTALFLWAALRHHRRVVQESV
jgi:phosphatidylglycerol lysyltransferase